MSVFSVGRFTRLAMHDCVWCDGLPVVGFDFDAPTLDEMIVCAAQEVAEDETATPSLLKMQKLLLIGFVMEEEAIYQTHIYVGLDGEGEGNTIDISFTAEEASLIIPVAAACALEHFKNLLHNVQPQKPRLPEIAELIGGDLVMQCLEGLTSANIKKSPHGQIQVFLERTRLAEVMGECLLRRLTQKEMLGDEFGLPAKETSICLNYSNHMIEVGIYHVSTMEPVNWFTYCYPENDMYEAISELIKKAKAA